MKVPNYQTGLLNILQENLSDGKLNILKFIIYSVLLFVYIYLNKLEAGAIQCLRNIRGDLFR